MSGTKFRAYTHVLRLDRPEVDGILNGDVSVFSKIDGTNSVMWYDSDDNAIHYGSRKREVTTEHDNAEFAFYMSSTNDPEVAALRNWVENHPTYEVYGEYIGKPGGKQLGTIKRYIENGFFIFDIFDTVSGKYISYEDYYDEIHSFYHRVIPRIVKLHNPTVEEVASYLDKCTYNLAPTDEEAGEGIVCKNYSYTDEYGHIQIAKIVRDEYLQSKGAKRKNKVTIDPSEQEVNFVEDTCTQALMAKEQNKIMIHFNLDSWRNEGKYIGMFLNELVDDIMGDEFWPYFRKNLISVDLKHIKTLIQYKGRKFLGLV